RPRRPVPVAESNGPWSGSDSPAVEASASVRQASDRSNVSFVSGDRADGAAAELVRLFARNAGLPEEAFAGRDSAELVAEIGQFVRLVTGSMKQLLDARQQAKRVTRSANQTTIQALDNNPLKFAPTTDDALRIMFGPPTKSYLDARSAFKQGVDDLKS